MINFGINGFGRIGRTALRVWWQDRTTDLELKMINTSGSMELEDWAHLLKYDTNYGPFKTKVTTHRQQSKDEVSDDNPILGTLTLKADHKTHSVVVTAQRDPAKLPWSDHQVEIVLESTGVFRTQEQAAQHFSGGAKFVIMSAPSKGGDVSSAVIGVNQFDSDKKVFSNASCTTNCVAPVMKVMELKFGVDKALLTTIHAYTDDQNLHDNSHSDLRRARAAAENLIPTTTGAAIATTQIIPELENKFDGMAIRVPIAVGSLSDIVFLLKQDTTVKEVNQAFIEASQDERWQGILAVTSEPLVSSDIVGRPESCIIDLSFTKVVGGNLVKIIGWYDNEWAYCKRLLEQMTHLPA